MTAALPLLLAVLVVVSSPASAQEIAYAYGESGGRPLESGNITQYNGTDVITSTIASGRYGGSSASRSPGLTADEIKKEIDIKLNVGNPIVRDAGRSLILEYPGDGTINQICSIYEHMVGNWSYARDTRGIEEFQYSNQSLEYGKGIFSGQGDCDDFSILMASLIESIGGTSRIVLAYGPNGGHAYTEVYLGKGDGSESDVQRIINWLKKNYKVKEINTHTDLKTDDVWLNLDWWKEPGGAKHPGGPFFKAASQTLIPTREDITPAPLKPVNDPPQALFYIFPEVPTAGDNASFDASESRDIGGRIDSYLWDFGDGNKTDKVSKTTANYIYPNGGTYTVILTVEDDEGVINSSSKKIMINNPPQADFTIMPQKPIVGDQVKFDASKSHDSEDGRNLAYHWEINNNSATFSVASPPKQVYDEKGMYWINLTVTDKNGAKDYKNILLKINQPPIPRIALDSTNLSLGKAINFSAATSEDLDGEIVSYTWDFKDTSEVEYNKTVLHYYLKSGEKTVTLSVKDNDGAISNISQEIFINRPPIASFSIDPQEPNKGESVSFDASSSSDPDGNILEYSWDFGEGKVEPDIYTSEFAVHTYYRPQKYNVKLTVKDDKGAIGSFSQLVEVKDFNNKPKIISFQPDKTSPQDAGTSITWTAEASDPDSDSILFKFFLNEEPLTDWQSQGRWTWTATDANMGDNSIEVRVRDGKHAGPEKYDASSLKSFRIIISNPVSDVVELATDQPPLPKKPKYETKRDANWALPQQAGDENEAVVLFGATRTPNLEDENAITEILKLDVGLMGVENATYQLIDADDNIYSPGLYKPLSSGKQLVYFLVPKDRLFKFIIVTPAGGKPIQINWWATLKGSNDRLVLRYYGITDWLIYPDEQGIVVQARVQNNGTKNLLINPQNFTLLDQWGWPYRPTLGFNPEIVTPQNATFERVLLGFTGISLISGPVALAYDYGMPDQIIIEEETKQGGIRALPLQAGDGNVTVVLFGTTRSPLADENAQQEILKVDVGLLGAENATYQLIDADDNIYSPCLYKPLSSGKQLVHFLVPKDSLFKLIIVTPAGGKPININWWATPKGSNDRLVLRYYGITDWLINPEEQSIVVQARVQNIGTQNLYVTPENFTLLDQWGWPYRPTLGFNPEIVEPQNATSERVLLGFFGISLISGPAALAYDYGMPDQIIIDFNRDYVPLSDELIYSAGAAASTPTKSIKDAIAASKARLESTKKELDTVLPDTN